MTIKEKIFFNYFEKFLNEGNVDGLFRSDTDNAYKPVEKRVSGSEESLRTKAFLLNRYVEAFFGGGNIDVNKNENDEVISDLLYKVLTGVQSDN